MSETDRKEVGLALTECLPSVWVTRARRMPIGSWKFGCPQKGKRLCPSGFYFYYIRSNCGFSSGSGEQNTFNWCDSIKMCWDFRIVMVLLQGGTFCSGRWEVYWGWRNDWYFARLWQFSWNYRWDWLNRHKHNLFTTWLLVLKSKQSENIRSPLSYFDFWH